MQQLFLPNQLHGIHRNNPHFPMTELLVPGHQGPLLVDSTVVPTPLQITVSLCQLVLQLASQLPSVHPLVECFLLWRRLAVSGTGA